MSRPPFIIAADSLPEDDGGYPGDDERLAFYRTLGAATGLTHLGVNLERVPPGRRTSYPHAHSGEDELVYVIEGEIDAWIDGVLHRMHAGDVAGFPAGTGIAHSFLNNGDRDAVLLVCGERRRPGDQVFYPLHPGLREVRGERWWSDPPPRRRGDHDGRAGCRVGAAARAWAEQLRGDGEPLDLRTLDGWSFGDSPAMADELVDLVIAGTKRATAALVWMYQHERLPLPVAGDRAIVTRGDGTPAVLIEFTDVDIRRFGDVDATFAATEGEGDGSLAYWRRVHWDYFARECAALGRTPSEDMAVLCSVFRVVRVAPAATAPTSSS